MSDSAAGKSITNPFGEARIVEHIVPGTWSFSVLAEILGDSCVPVHLVDELGIARKEEQRLFQNWQTTPAGDSADAPLVPCIRGLDVGLCPSLARALADRSAERHRFVRGLFCGLRGSVTALHADEKDNTLTVLNGMKVVYVISKDLARDLSMSQMAGLNKAICTEFAPALLRVPHRELKHTVCHTDQIQGVTVQRFIIVTGSALEIPRAWLHAVVNLSDCVAASAWQRNGLRRGVSQSSSVSRNISGLQQKCGMLSHSLWSVILSWAFSKDPRGIGALASTSKAVNVAAADEQLWASVLCERWQLQPEEVTAEHFAFLEASTRTNFMFCKRAEESMRMLFALPRYCKYVMASEADSCTVPNGTSLDPFDSYTPRQLGSLLFAYARNSAHPIREQVGRIIARCPDKFVAEDIRHKICRHAPDMLAGFMMQLDIEGCSLVDACRRLFQVLILPGEAQMIDFLMQGFAQHFAEAGGGYLEEETHMEVDAAYVLAFSLIMLSTDLHNPGVKNKMSERDFVAPQRGMNNGGNFSDALIQGYYRNIAADPLDLHPKPRSSPPVVESGRNCQLQ